MLTTAVFELVQQFYHATEISNVANAVNGHSMWPETRVHYKNISGMRMRRIT